MNQRLNKLEDLALDYLKKRPFHNLFITYEIDIKRSLWRFKSKKMEKSILFVGIRSLFIDDKKIKIKKETKNVRK